jgi:hypothetical protein
VPIVHTHLQTIGQTIDAEEAEIVGRELVLDARISKPHDQLHIRDP